MILCEWKEIWDIELFLNSFVNIPKAYQKGTPMRTARAVIKK